MCVVPADLGLPPTFEVEDLLTGERFTLADRPQLRAPHPRPPARPRPGGGAPVMARRPLPTAEWLRRQRWFGAKGSAPIDRRRGRHPRWAATWSSPVRRRRRRPATSWSGWPATTSPTRSAEPLTGAALGRALGRSPHGTTGRAARSASSGPPRRHRGPTGPSARSGPSSRTPRSSSADQVVVKVFRRIEDGENPELEMLRFLGRQGYDHVPAIAGWADAHRRATAPSPTLAVAQDLVRDGRDGWELVLERLGGDDRGASPSRCSTTSAPPWPACTPASAPTAPTPTSRRPPAAAPWPPSIADRDRGRRRATCCPAVATLLGEAVPVVAPEVVAATARSLADRLDAGPGAPPPRRPPPGPDAAHARRLGDPRLRGRAGPAARRPVGRSSPPLRDLAGLLRSLVLRVRHPRPSAAVLDPRVGAGRPRRGPRRLPRPRRPRPAARRPVAPPSGCSPCSSSRRSLYELDYELGNRPDWVRPPPRGTAAHRRPPHCEEQRVTDSRLGDLDLHLLGEGRHHRLYERLGAHVGRRRA